MSIQLEQLTKRHEGHSAVNHFSLSVAEGEFFVLLGAKGSGKTTLLNLIGGVTAADVEVGAPQALYQRPKTEFVATSLGTANLLVGLATRDSIHLGPHHFPLPDELPTVPLDNARRVQVLFRPEEVALATSEQGLRNEYSKFVPF